MAVIAALAIAAGALGIGSYLSRFWAKFDPASPHAYNGDVARTMQVFAEAETARQVFGPQGGESLHGLDQIIASEAIRKIPASARLDFARQQTPDPDTLRIFLSQIQRQAIEKAKESPEAVDYGMPWRVALTQLKRGSFLEGVGLVSEAFKRNLDTFYSRKTGYNDSFGRNFARSVGVEETNPVFDVLSGTLDTGTVILGDPTLLLGKGAKTARLAAVEGRVPLRGINRVLGVLAPSKVLDTESGKILDTADWAARMPGVRNWANRMAREQSAGQVLYWERIGGGIIDDDFTRRAIANADDPEVITNILADGIRSGQVQRLPVYSAGKFRNRTSMMARASYTNYGKRVWNDTLDVNDPHFEDDFLTLHRYFQGKNLDEGQARQWLDDFGNAARGEKMKITEQMVQDGLKAKSRDILAPHAKKLAAKIGSKADNFDTLVDDLIAGTDEEVIGKGRKIGLTLADDAEGESLRTSVRDAVNQIPDQLSDDAWERVRKYTGGYATEKEAAAYGYVPGRVIDSPILSTQLQQHMRVPSFQNLWNWEQELHGLARAKGLGKRTFARTSRSLDKALSGWRGLVLSTPRTHLRNAMDDFAGAVSHPEWGGTLLRRWAWGAWDMSAGAGFPGRSFFRFAAGARSKGLRRSVEEASLAIPERDLAHFAEDTGKFADALQTNQRIRASTTYDKVVGLGGSINRELESELAGRSLAQADWNHWRWVGKEDTAFTEAYAHFVNHQVLQDDAVKTILHVIDDPDESVAMMRAYLDSEAGKVQRQLVKVAKDDADFVTLKRELLDTSIPAELMPFAKLGYVPPEEIQRLWKKSPELFPDFVRGPSGVFNSSASGMTKAIGGASGVVKRGVDWSFGVGGAVGDMLVRNPAYRTAFKYNYDRFAAQAKKLAGDGVEVAEDELIYRATRAAERQVLDQVDDFAQRTRLGTLLRGYVPFLDAHMRFWKRWGKNAMRNPAFVEQVRLLFGAGESLGWIEPDDNGNLVFTAPIMPQLAAALLPGDTDLYKSWFSFTVGAQSEIISKKGPGGVVQLAENLGRVVVPKGIPFAIEVIPGLSPVVSLPVDYLTLDMPGVREVAETILGPAPRINPSRENFASSVIGSFMPAWTKDVFRIFDDEGQDEIKGQAVADALKSVMYEYSQAHDGQLPKTREEVEKLYETARARARDGLVFKVLGRLFSPYSQSRVPYHKEVAEEWHYLRATKGPEEGFAEFMAKHGEGSVFYTIPQSKVKDGQAPINYSPEAEAFYIDNPDFFRDHGAVAGFFTRDMPGFDYQVLSRFRRRGERNWIPPQDLLAEAFYRLGNEEYYEKVRPMYQRVLAGVKGTAARRALSLWLEGERVKIEAKYPGWMEGYAAASANSNLRKVAIDDLYTAVRHPAVAETKAADATRRFLSLYDQAHALAEQNGFSTIDGKNFAPVRQWLAGQARALAATSGSEGFKSLYEFLFRPQLERDEDVFLLQGAQAA